MGEPIVRERDAWMNGWMDQFEGVAKMTDK